MSSVWTTVITTIATLLGVLAGGVLTRRTQDRHWLRDTKAGAYSAVLHEYIRIEVTLRTGHRLNQAPQVDWAPWGAALATLSLVAEDEVVAAAEHISQTFVRMEETAIGGGQHVEWQRLQRQLVENQMAFVNAARRSLDRSQPQLTIRVGGPLLASGEPEAPAPARPDGRLALTAHAAPGEPRRPGGGRRGRGVG